MKIAMLFPGYGSQFVGMGKELYDEYRIVQEYFEEASNCLNNNFVRLCFASSDVELGKMSNAYPALFLITGATYALIKQKGISPSVVAGYNDGEYGALFAAECFSFPDGLYLLSKYAAFYQEVLANIDVGVVRIVGVSTEELSQIFSKSNVHKGKVFIAIYNGKTDHVIAGYTKSVQYVCNAVSQLKSIQINQLDAAVGLHSELMNPVAEQFSMYLEKVDFKNLSVPMIDSFNARLIKNHEEVKRHILKHINSPLVFTNILDNLKKYDLIVSVGLSSSLDVLVKEQYPEKQTIVIQTCADLANLEKIALKT